MKTKRANNRRTTNVDVAVGRALMVRRTELGLSQSAVATRAGIAFQQIQKYENGANRVSASRLWQFCAILDVPVDYFFAGLGQPSTNHASVAAPKIPRKQDREAMRLARKIVSIEDPQFRRTVVELLAGVAR